MADYVVALKKDLAEQFRGKENIDALIEVIGAQLQQVYDFYDQLQYDRDVHTAIGKNLDGVGDIAVLSRYDAARLAGNTRLSDVMDDEVYRKYLIFKIIRNTCDCTYPDIIRTFRMFWNKPLYYREDPEKPATMILESGTLRPEDDARRLLEAPIIRAAGVGIKVIAVTENYEMRSGLGISTQLGRGYTTTVLPEASERVPLENTCRPVPVAQNITQTILTEVKEETT